MDVVTNLTEHVQTLELKPNAGPFTAYQTIDNTILIDYSEDLIKDQYCLNHRHFLFKGNDVEQKESIDCFYVRSAKWGLRIAIMNVAFLPITILFSNF